MKEFSPITPNKANVVRIQDNTQKIKQLFESVKLIPKAANIP